MVPESDQKAESREVLAHWGCCFVRYHNYLRLSQRWKETTGGRMKIFVAQDSTSVTACSFSQWINLQYWLQMNLAYSSASDKQEKQEKTAEKITITSGLLFILSCNNSITGFSPFTCKIKVWFAVFPKALTKLSPTSTTRSRPEGRREEKRRSQSRQPLAACLLHHWSFIDFTSSREKLKNQDRMITYTTLSWILHAMLVGGVAPTNREDPFELQAASCKLQARRSCSTPICKRQIIHQTYSAAG